jgi:hypothetical protein
MGQKTPLFALTGGKSTHLRRCFLPFFLKYQRLASRSMRGGFRQKAASLRSSAWDLGLGALDSFFCAEKKFYPVPGGPRRSQADQSGPRPPRFWDGDTAPFPSNGERGRPARSLWRLAEGIRIQLRVHWRSFAVFNSGQVGMPRCGVHWNSVGRVPPRGVPASRSLAFIRGFLFLLLPAKKEGPDNRSGLFTRMHLRTSASTTPSPYQIPASRLVTSTGDTAKSKPHRGERAIAQGSALGEMPQNISPSPPRAGEGAGVRWVLRSITSPSADAGNQPLAPIFPQGTQ